jgi:hypothetical protein
MERFKRLQTAICASRGSTKGKHRHPENPTREYTAKARDELRAHEAAIVAAGGLEQLIEGFAKRIAQADV